MSNRLSKNDLEKIGSAHEKVAENKHGWEGFTHTEIHLMKPPTVEISAETKHKIFQENVNVVMTDVRNHNVGKSDYAKHNIQPWDIWIEYKMNPFDADIVKMKLFVKIGS